MASRNPVTFAIYPEPHRRNCRLYYAVFIWRTKQDMHNAVAALRKLRKWSRVGNNYLGIVMGFTNRDPKVPHCVGHVHLCRKAARRGGIVTHEMAHAASYYWMNHVGSMRMIETAERNDERFAYIVGELNRQYWANWYRSVGEPH